MASRDEGDLLGSSVADATMQTTLLKPHEKTVRRGQRKRPALRLDKCSCVS